MSKALLYNADGLVTIEQIAEHTGRTVRGIRKKKGIEEYYVKHVPAVSGHGKHVAMYNIQALKLWDALPTKFETTIMPKNRKERADKSRPRTIPIDLWEIGVPLIRNAYINNPSGDCFLMCERVCAYLHQEGYPLADAQKFYKAIMRKEPARDMYGVFHAENWKQLRDRNLHRATETLNSATPGYDRYSILQRAGLAGEGFGACRIIVIDDFKRDAWVNLDGTPVMPEGLAFIDGLTGFPLLYEPCTSLTTAAVARGILKVAFMWGLYDDTVWVIENSKAMKNVNVDGLIFSLYTDEMLEEFKSKTWISQYFDGQPPSPIVHSLPHIPREKAKAMIESQFNRIKHEYDSVNYALQFQGGNRSEAVTITRARMPYFTGKNLDKLPDDYKLVPYDEYWIQLHYWMYVDSEMSYIDRPRPKFKALCKGLGIPNTLRAVFNYFNDNSGRQTPELSIEKYSRMLYFSQPNRTKPDRLLTIKNTTRNGITCTIDGEQIILINNAFFKLIGHSVAVLPVPFDDNQFVVMRADQPENPQFVGIFKRQIARELEEVREVQINARIVRETCDREMDKVIEQSKINRPALSPHRDSQKKNTVLTPHSSDLLSGKDSVDWVDSLQDDIIDNIELNTRSRAISTNGSIGACTNDPVAKAPKHTNINFINNRRKAFLADIEASLQEISNG